MTDKEILEGNKLIAKFMGYTVYKAKQAFHNIYGGCDGFHDACDMFILNPTEEFKKYLIVDEPQEVGLDIDFKLCEEWHYDVKYNSSWDWLMPCFEKITELNANFTLNENYCYIELGGEWSNTCSENINCDFELGLEGSTMLEAAYNCLIEFIKWYNESK